MSSNDENLKRALDDLNSSIFRTAVGFTNENMQVNILRQNNCIIELLLSLHKKIDQLGQGDMVQPLENTISDLSAEVANLNLSPSTEEKPTVKATPKEILLSGKIQENRWENTERDMASTSNSKVLTTLPSHDIVRGYNTNIFRKYRKKTDEIENKIVLDQLVDPAKQLKIMQDKNAELVPAEVLYKHGFRETKSMVYQHSSEEIISCCFSETQLEMNFISEKSQRKLKQSNHLLLHVGLVLIGVHSLRRHNYGSKVMIALVDASDSNPKKATIGSMEIDMSKGMEVCYLVPDMLITVNDFCKYFKLVIKTKGYDTMTDTENLLLSKTLVGRLGNNSSLAPKLQIDNALHHLKSKGIRAIPGQSISPDELAGGEWTISLKPQVAIPTAVEYWPSAKGDSHTTSFRFIDYKASSSEPQQDSDEVAPKVKNG